MAAEVAALVRGGVGAMAWVGRRRRRRAVGAVELAPGRQGLAGTRPPDGDADCAAAEASTTATAWRETPAMRRPIRL